MRPAAEKLKAELDQTDFAPPRVPVIANVDVSDHGSADHMRDLLYRQVFSPVRWQASIERLVQDGIERFVEVGPGRVLTGLMRKIDRKKTAVNVSTAESLEQFVTAESSRSTP
jgi:[acyl-carrier-protein] S-malonyltransferase